MVHTKGLSNVYTYHRPVRLCAHAAHRVCTAANLNIGQLWLQLSCRFKHMLSHAAVAAATPTALCSHTNVPALQNSSSTITHSSKSSSTATLKYSMCALKAGSACWPSQPPCILILSCASRDHSPPPDLNQDTCPNRHAPIEHTVSAVHTTHASTGSMIQLGSTKYCSHDAGHAYAQLHPCSDTAVCRGTHSKPQQGTAAIC
jgi:hypothetical protein